MKIIEYWIKRLMSFCQNDNMMPLRESSYKNQDVEDIVERSNTLVFWISLEKGFGCKILRDYIPVIYQPIKVIL
jgi:predicted enzyme involved in methoxymalonyl-ACP biosynthesis